jgi:hypothetical protein
MKSDADERLDTLIVRTANLHAEIRAHVACLNPAEDLRYHVAFQSGLLSLDHATAALSLIHAGCFPSAYALMRPQFESLVRGIWLLHAASDAWVRKLSEPLSNESANRANSCPMMGDMLRELKDAPKRPGHIIEQLERYRDVTWKGLNSYAHGGLHPLSRTTTGYPAELTYDVLQNSNGVVALTVQLASILTCDPEDMHPVRKLHTDYADCIPILNAN